jgi:hypothetical protein
MSLSRSLLAGMVLVLALFAPLLVVRAQVDTYAVSASVLFCDVDPATLSGEQASDVCGDPYDGTVIDLSDTDEVIGSCTTEIVETPWDSTMNMCGIDGAGYNTTLTFTLDETTLPAGYVLVENDLSVDVDDLIPGGGDQTTVTFLAVREDAEDGAHVPQDSEAIGFNADILTGSCAAPGSSVAILEAVVVETGASVGAATATGPETSVSVVDIPLDMLIDEPHMISVYGVNDQAGDRVLCGDIGGVDNDDGTLYIVLSPLDASLGAVGIAALSYGEDAANETIVRLFVASTT